jgi:hypothetical protein
MKQLKSFLDENTIYTTPAEKAAVLADKEKVMNLFFFNFLMFLGMFKMNDQTAGMKNYENAEGKLQIDNIGDDNHDVSVSVKLAYDSGFLLPAVTTRITKLLFLIKSKRLSGKDLDENLIRGIIADIKYKTFRPSPKVLAIVDQFQDGKLDLEHTAKELYLLSKIKPNKDGTLEVRELVMKGKYNTIFGKMGDYVPPSTTTTQTPTTTSQSTVKTPTTDASTVVKNDSPAPKKLKDVVSPETQATTTPTTQSPKGISNQFWIDLFNTRTADEYNAVLKTYGVKKYEATDKVTFLDIDLGISSTHGNYPLFSNWEVYKQLKKLGTSSFVKLTMNELNNVFENISNISQCEARLKAVSETILDNNNLILSKRDTKPSDMVRIYAFLRQKNEEVFNLLKEDNSEERIKQISEFLVFLGTFYRELIPNKSNTLPVMADMDSIKNGLDTGDESILKAFISFRMCSTSNTILQNILSFVKTGIENLLKLEEDSLIYFPYTTDTIELSTDNYNNLPMSIRRVIDMDLPFKIFKIVKTRTPAEIVYEFVRALAMNQKDFSYFDQLTKNSDMSEFTQSVITEGIRQAKAQPDVGKNLGEFLQKFNRYTINHMSNAKQLVLNDIVIGVYKLVWNDDTIDAKQFRNMAQDLTILSRMLDIGVSLKFLKLVVSAYFAPEITDKVFEYRVKHNIPTDYGFFQNNIAKIKENQKETPLPSDEDVKSIFFDALSSYSILVEYSNRIYNAFPKMKEELLSMVNQRVNTATNIAEVTVLGKHFQLLGDEIPDEIVVKMKRLLNNDVKNGKLLENFTGIANFPEKLKEKLRGDLFEQTMKSPVLNRTSSLLATALFTPEQANKFVEITFDHQPIEIDRYSIGLMKSFSNEDNWKAVSSKTILNFSNLLKTDSGYAKGIKDTLDETVNRIIDKLVVEDKDEVLEDVFQKADTPTRKKLANRIMNVKFIEQSAKLITNDVIKPLMSIDNNSLVSILKYNDIHVPSMAVKKNELTTYKALQENIEKTISDSGLIQDLKVAKVDNTEEELDRLTIEYDVFNKYRHGNIGVKFLEEFDVNIEKQNQGQQEFLEYMPSTEVIDPAFHGTGSVAASMILRFGFAIITGSGGAIKTTGKMLGDGIYFSNVLDKVAQYTGDEGYTRGVGTVGYIFQMHALLGSRGADYDAAGLVNDGIISPEWCVFSPNKQLKIYKTFKVEIVDKSYIQNLKEQYKINENIVKIKAFKEFIKEATENYTNATTYIFMDGNIPVSENKAVESNEFDPSKFGDHVRVEPGQTGPLVVISHNHPESEAFCVASTQEFMWNDAEINKFLNLLNGR